MKNLLKNKFLLVLGALVLIIVVLALSGALKLNFNVSRSGEASVPADETSPVSSGEPTGQVNQLSASPVAFTAADGALEFSIYLPVGWRVGSSDEADFVAGSLLADTLPTGDDFTTNLNASVRRHPSSVSSFADYQNSWKPEIQRQMPSLSVVNDYSKQVNGKDVYILEVRNTRPDGVVIHQIQSVYYLDDTYYMVVPASAPDSLWDKYQPVFSSSIESIQQQSVAE